VLPNQERLRRASLFQRVYAGKKNLSSTLFTLYVLPRQARSAPKLPLAGFVVGRKVDKRATVRNKIKRQVREAYRKARLEKDSINNWYAVVWVIHQAALKASFAEITNQVNACLERAGKKHGSSAIKDTMFKAST
jgi:ribonuclease P protein component